MDMQVAQPVYPEFAILDAVEQSIRQTTKSYGYQHLATIGEYLRNQFPGFDPAHYGCEKVLNLIERYPDRFKVKWSAPLHKGRSHVWVRLAAEPKTKYGYSPKSTDATKPEIQARIMTQAEFTRLCEWLNGSKGVNIRPDGGIPPQITWDCDGTLHKTRLWLKRHNLHIEKNVSLVKRLGGHCDCEVLFNVIDRWPSS